MLLYQKFAAKRVGARILKSVSILAKSEAKVEWSLFPDMVYLTELVFAG